MCFQFPRTSSQVCRRLPKIPGFSHSSSASRTWSFCHSVTHDSLQ